MTRADLTVFELADCEEIVTDSLGEKLTIRRRFEPRWAAVGPLLQEAGRS